jgi:hypothetical protein
MLLLGDMISSRHVPAVKRHPAPRCPVPLSPAGSRCGTMRGVSEDR